MYFPFLFVAEWKEFKMSSIEVFKWRIMKEK